MRKILMTGNQKTKSEDSELNGYEETRTPAHCSNRAQNKFRCAGLEENNPRTPDRNGVDCRDCPRYRYTDEPERKKKQAEKESLRWAWVAVLIAVFSLAVIGLAVWGIYSGVSFFMNR